MQDKFQNIHVRMDRDLYDKLKAKSKAEKRSMTATLHIILEECLINKSEVSYELKGE